MSHGARVPWDCVVGKHNVLSPAVVTPKRAVGIIRQAGRHWMKAEWCAQSGGRLYDHRYPSEEQRWAPYRKGNMGEVYIF